MNRLEIDVYSDFVCPWCFIGSRRLEAVLQSIGETHILMRHRPYLLYPNVPSDGIELRASLSERYGQDPERLFEPVEAAGRQSGIPLDFSKVTRVYSTVDAHTLVRHAHAKGTQSGLAGEIFTAYFVEGQNIADRNVLVHIAVRHGFTLAETHAILDDPAERLRTRDEADRVAKSGIRGVPLYVINGRETVSGAQSPSVFTRAIKGTLPSLA